LTHNELELMHDELEADLLLVEHEAKWVKDKFFK